MTTYSAAVCHARQHNEKVYTMFRKRHIRTHRELRHGSHSFICKLHHARLLFRKRSPAGATPNWGGRHMIGAYYSLIDPKGWKAELPWLVDLYIADGLPIQVVTHQLQVERRTGKFSGQRPTFYRCSIRNQRSLKSLKHPFITCSC